MHCKWKDSVEISGKEGALRRVRNLTGLAVLVFALPCLAQRDRSALSGTVTDSAGRLLPQARVTVAESATGLRREAISDANGSYNIPPPAGGHLHGEL